MVVDQITRYTHQEIKDLSAGKRIVILYPQLTYRNLFLAPFLDLPGDSVHYRPKSRNLSAENFVQDWAAELNIDAHQSLLHLEKQEFAAAGRVFAQEINASYQQQTILFLDDFDLLEMSASLSDFFYALAIDLDPQLQVIVNGRNLWSEPWTQLIKSGHAVVIGMRDRPTDLRFAVDSSARPNLEVYGFGAGSAFLNGKELNTWDGILPRNLFFLFADHTLLTRNQIFEIFWPELRVKEATNVFHVTKRKITENLMVRANSSQPLEVLTFVNGFYRTSEDFIFHYDVTDFTDYATRALQSAENHERVLYAERALSLYRGAFLETINMQWVLDRREKLRRMYIDLLILLARLHHGQGDLMTAFNWYIQATREAPQREDLQRNVMNLYVELGRPDDARQQYHFLRNYLRTTYGIEPSPETRALYEMIQERGGH